MSGAPRSLRRLPPPWLSPGGATLDVVRVWQRLSTAEQSLYGPPAILISVGEAAAYRVDGRGALPYEAGHYHGGILLQDALDRTPELRAMFESEHLPPRPDLSVFGIRQCRRCGCTDAVACPEGCFWVAADLCSSCAR